MKPHLQTCGTAYRGCDPNCPKEIEEREDRARTVRVLYDARQICCVDGECGCEASQDLQKWVETGSRSYLHDDHDDLVLAIWETLSTLRSERDEALAVELRQRMQTERDEARAEVERCGVVHGMQRAELHQMRLALDGAAHRGAQAEMERDEARAERDSLRAEIERWRHGVTIEGDYVCPDSLALTRTTAVGALLAAALRGGTWAERDAALSAWDRRDGEVG